MLTLPSVLLTEKKHPRGFRTAGILEHIHMSHNQMTTGDSDSFKYDILSQTINPQMQI